MPYTQHPRLQAPGTMARAAQRAAQAAAKKAAKATKDATKTAAAQSSSSATGGRGAPKNAAAATKASSLASTVKKIPKASKRPRARSFDDGVDEAELFEHLPDWMTDEAHSALPLGGGGWAELGNIPLDRSWYPDEEPILVAQLDFGKTPTKGPLAYMAGIAIFQNETDLVFELLIDEDLAEEMDIDIDELLDRTTNTPSLSQPTRWETHRLLRAIAKEAGDAWPKLRGAIWGWVLVGMKRLLIAAEDGKTDPSAAEIAKAWGGWLLRHGVWAQHEEGMWTATTLRPLLLTKERAVREVAIKLMGEVVSAPATSQARALGSLKRQPAKGKKAA